MLPARLIALRICVLEQDRAAQDILEPPRKLLQRDEEEEEVVNYWLELTECGDRLVQLVPFSFFRISSPKPSSRDTPMNKLLFGTETKGECQDLAGNAMTTSVIGALIKSA
jgi:hypothetical protein